MPTPRRWRAGSTRGRRERSRARAARSTCNAGRRRRPATSRSEQFQRMADGRGLARRRRGYRRHRQPDRRRDLTSSSPVTVITASQEDLGDLKLYRIPEPVTVAAHSQKQVALADPAGRAGRLGLSAGRLSDRGSSAEARRLQPAILVLTARNRAADGLGLPLPAGRLAAVRRARPAGRCCSAKARCGDHAVGEEVEIELGDGSRRQQPDRHARRGPALAPLSADRHQRPRRARRLRGASSIDDPETMRFASAARAAARPALMGGHHPAQRQRVDAATIAMERDARRARPHAGRPAPNLK